MNFIVFTGWLNLIERVSLSKIIALISGNFANAALFSSLVLYELILNFTAIERPVLSAFKTESLTRSVFIMLKLLQTCLLYTSDAADEEDSVDLGGRRI